MGAGGEEGDQADAQGRRSSPEIVSDPVESAQAAGLRYVSDTQPGIRRKRAGKGFVYVGTDGKTIRDAKELARIRSLAIPPAYTDVWICPSPNGHIQATGRDARGRKQYRYHPKWREVRDETKFGRMLAFSEALPKIRARLERDLSLPGLPREKVLATVVRLLECTCIRVGNDEYAKSNRSFGLTTLQDRHVEISGSNLRFEFRGKSGKMHKVDLNDRRLARIVQRCQDLPGEDLFQYLDDDGVRQTIGSGDVNDYIREISGQEFTAKDFRTWAGTLLADRGADQDRRLLHSAKRKIERAPGHRSGRRAAEQHPLGVPEVLRAPGRVRVLHGRQAAGAPGQRQQAGRQG